jgi:prepilin-type processing-associated H-X9-DG protein
VPEFKGSVLVKILPYVEQQPLYDKIDFRIQHPSNGIDSIVDASGRHLYSYSIDTFRCPSATNDVRQDPNNPDSRALGNYAPSIGAQAMPAQGGWCTLYPGNTFGTGAAGHGNDWSGRNISGVFSRLHWASRFADIKDGTSNTIAMGEIRPECGDHSWNSWYHANSIWVATTAPINYPIRCVGEPGWEGATDCGHWRNWQTSQGFKSLHPGGAQFVFADGSTHFLSETIDYRTYQQLGDRRDGEPVGPF